MDIVITFVNGLDPVWQREYEEYTNTPILEKRFRDWGTLKPATLRGKILPKTVSARNNRCSFRRCFRRPRFG